ncbi:serine/threonine-protein kinase [Mycobacteroides abscessus]|uniref:serine/threonine-protein kinase n=1 Tax=Mycobacteroides abscessus TaxID=36809 RepID=UPI001F2A7B51|nr:serine/threonine-protein kinase [Mycobacteroides abscessus]
MNERVELHSIESPDRMLARRIPLLVLVGVGSAILTQLVVGIPMATSAPEVANIVSVLALVGVPGVMYVVLRARLSRELREVKRLALTPEGLERTDATTVVSVRWSDIAGFKQAANRISTGPKFVIAPVPVMGMLLAAGSVSTGHRDTAITGPGVIKPGPRASRAALVKLDRILRTSLASGQAAATSSALIFPGEFEQNWADGIVGQWIQRFRPDLLGEAPADAATGSPVVPQQPPAPLAKLATRLGQPTPAAADTAVAGALGTGTVIGGYTIERLLGAGGMGEVYVARHPRLPRADALKVLGPELTHDRMYRRRFEREADLAAALSHPAIVKVHDRGEADGRLWMALELIDGTDLGRIIKTLPTGLETSQVAQVARAVAEALDYAGGRGLVHRDVKPANILISTGGHVLLTDFGVARLSQEASELTATGATVGTLSYASPEQLCGEPLDSRSDQYALACTVFHLLTGRPPFIGATAAHVIAAHLGQAAPAVSTVRTGLPTQVDTVVARALSKNRSERYGTSNEFAADLMSALGGATTAATSREVRPVAPGSLSPASAARSRTGKRWAAVAAVAVIGTASVAAAVWWRDDATTGSVSDEAKTLTPVLTTTLLPSLEKAPSAARWTYTPDPQARGVQIVGGDDSRILVSFAKYAANSGGESTYFLDVLDTENGRSQGIAEFPAGQSFSKCAVIAQTALCAGDSVSFFVDLPSRQVRQTPELVRDPVASGEIFIPGTPRANDPVYRVDGSVSWRFTADVNQQDVAADQGVFRTGFTTASADPVAQSRDGQRVQRLSDGVVLYEAADNGSGWGAFQGGFGVSTGLLSSGSADKAIKYFGLDGHPLGSLTVNFGGHEKDWSVQSFDGAAPSLPMVWRKDPKDRDSRIIGVINPATGNLLWSKSVPGAADGAYEAMGRQLVLQNRSGKKPAMVFDLYTGEGGEPRSSDPALKVVGTDGTRVVLVREDGTVYAATPAGQLLWQRPLTTKYVQALGAGLYTTQETIARIL